MHLDTITSIFSSEHHDHSHLVDVWALYYHPLQIGRPAGTSSMMAVSHRGSYPHVRYPINLILSKNPSFLEEGFDESPFRPNFGNNYLSGYLLPLVMGLSLIKGFYPSSGHRKTKFRQYSILRIPLASFFFCTWDSYPCSYLTASPWLIAGLQPAVASMACPMVCPIKLRYSRMPLSGSICHHMVSQVFTRQEWEMMLSAF